MTDQPRALVTGSGGFVGGHLVRRLAAEGYAVTALDVAPTRADLPPEVRQAQVDLRDATEVRAAVRDASPAMLFHLAAQSSVAVSMRDPAADVEHNVLATIHLAHAASEAGARRFVFTSTGGALYGAGAPVPAVEDTRALPDSIYGASKLAAEHYLRVIGASSGLEVAVVRPANIYGPEQNPHGEAGVVAIFAERMLRDEPVTVFGDGSQTRDYVYVDDVVQALLDAARAPEPATCLAGTGVETSTRQIFDLLAGFTGYERAPVEAPDRPGDVPRIAVDPARARETWGWTPRVGLEEGLERTVAWFRERRDGAR